jgi:hypothetical protein
MTTAKENYIQMYAILYKDYCLMMASGDYSFEKAKEYKERIAFYAHMIGLKESVAGDMA